MFDAKDYLGKMVSFQLWPSTIITDDFTQVKIVGVVGSEAAQSYISPARQHTLVYPMLPEGTPNDYRLYDYILVRKQDNTLTAVGIPWVKESTLTVIGSTEYVVTIRDKTNDDLALLRRVLMENNFTNFSIDSTNIDA